MRPSRVLAALDGPDCHHPEPHSGPSGGLRDPSLLPGPALPSAEAVQAPPHGGQRQEDQVQLRHRQPQPALRKGRPRILTSDHPTGDATLGHHRGPVRRRLGYERLIIRHPPTHSNRPLYKAHPPPSSTPSSLHHPSSLLFLSSIIMMIQQLLVIGDFDPGSNRLGTCQKDSHQLYSDLFYIGPDSILLPTGTRFFPLYYICIKER